ncbi:MAG: response regulator [Pseudomonadota bacterium]
MSLTLLIVDDSRLSRTMIKHIIQVHRPDLNIIEAEDGAGAIAVLEQGGVNMGIIDINMPGLSGIDLIDAIQENYTAVQLAFLSANIQQGMRDRAREKNIGFFSKPITEQTILAILKSFG